MSYYKNIFCQSQLGITHFFIITSGLGTISCTLDTKKLARCPTPPHDSPDSDLTQVHGGWNRMRCKDVIRTTFTILSKDESAIQAFSTIFIIFLVPYTDDFLAQVKKRFKLTFKRSMTKMF